ncbi:MAG: hypothetical protein UX26_C0004G0008 [Parcubacteria group bacterium GW2011_GWC1_45_9]|nr:MAG: hypothetical protein UW85_C0009G0005 [Parcubacteria group bacterium GW2011_GWA1_Parcubacteria_45_10]KKT88494.1 MAG: hypothetical protein UW89_C0007G0037 [Parcubacteria group bacterium GW2011_GWB1_45_10]KKU17255.1 MAG: hypothetical protein UX26_C0004G0008 [Parcubacteria group bacterium GW2011_GWC1_45_9]
MNPVRNIHGERVSNSSTMKFLNNNKISHFYRISKGVNKRIIITEGKAAFDAAEPTVVFALVDKELTFSNF